MMFLMPPFFGAAGCDAVTLDAVDCDAAGCDVVGCNTVGRNAAVFDNAGCDGFDNAKVMVVPNPTRDLTVTR